ADPLGDLVSRYARTHGPFTAHDVADSLGIGASVAMSALERIVERGRVVTGGFRPDHRGTEWCDVDVLRQVRRRTVAALRHEIEPVPASTLVEFLPRWQRISEPQSGVDGLFAVIEQLAGAQLPASQLESLILPARVRDYSPAMLDELLATGEVAWWGTGSLPGRDGWIALGPSDLAPLLIPAPEPVEDPLALRILTALDGRAIFSRDLAQSLSTEALVPEADVRATLLTLAWSGHVTNDTFLPVRAHLGARGHVRRTPVARRRRTMPRTNLPPPDGRWSLLPAPSADATARALAQAESVLVRFGIVTRETATGFASTYRVLRALEDAGRCRRAYVLEGQGAAQFALAGAIDEVRRCAATPSDTARQGRLGRPAGPVRTLAAADPAQPFGAALPWPESAVRPSRSAGALVTLGHGQPLLYLAKGHRSLTTWPCEDPEGAARSLAGALRGHAVSLQRIDGDDIASAPTEWVSALVAAGFARTPSGLRLRA
ncbi:MAG: hypothetical protein ACKOYQ_02690, partial [Actinomycetota bacterium]